ncbi:hypothetical protein HN858_03535 [Candidatus Falkowbacteria bacterium]|nr:hypothetical protein [Candidatus Falkowbacteria bacterium]MBT6574131.1 hypothetical protein [Candidatus Falkowbacteria bacterium]MBT7348722.1 hypothetical protein [Candidatus Falkowbacteria bacterium]MBT7500512.1 hypothetical protein [Candidatus Falkowbacteria bacterium]
MRRVSFLVIVVIAVLFNAQAMAWEKFEDEQINTEEQLMLMVDYSKPIPALTVLQVKVEKQTKTIRKENGATCEQEVSRKNVYGRRVMPELTPEGEQIVIYLQPIPELDWIVVKPQEQKAMAVVLLPGSRTAYYPFKLVKELKDGSKLYSLSIDTVVQCDAEGKCQTEEKK